MYQYLVIHILQATCCNDCRHRNRQAVRQQIVGQISYPSPIIFGFRNVVAFQMTSNGI